MWKIAALSVVAVFCLAAAQDAAEPAPAAPEAPKDFVGISGKVINEAYHLETQKARLLKPGNKERLRQCIGAPSKKNCDGNIHYVLLSISIKDLIQSNFKCSRQILKRLPKCPDFVQDVKALIDWLQETDRTYYNDLVQLVLNRKRRG